MKEMLTKHRPIIIMEWTSKRITDDFKQYDLLNKIFNNYTARVILTNHEYIYRKVRNKTIINWFRCFLKPFFTYFSSPKVITTNFNYSENYQQNVILIPNEKLSLINL